MEKTEENKEVTMGVFSASATDQALTEALTENERLRVELENTKMRYEIARMNASIASGEVPSFKAGDVTHPVMKPQPIGPGGAPVPLPPRVPVQEGPPKQGDVVNVSCRSGAVIRATGQRCDGRRAKIQGIMGNNGVALNGGGGRRVIYVCQKCSQPWTITY